MVVPRLPVDAGGWGSGRAVPRARYEHAHAKHGSSLAARNRPDPWARARLPGGSRRGTDRERTGGHRGAGWAATTLTAVRSVRSCPIPARPLPASAAAGPVRPGVTSLALAGGRP
ncbi:hypothetical protein TNCT1_48660 [Streptomyces sp. 1-11]|nr:hypothetical protein TNCT1_48660 [Streptomyces sp. 1-11]